MFRRTHFAPKFSELFLLFCYIKIKLYNYECRDNDPILHSTTGRMHSDAKLGCVANMIINILVYNILKRSRPCGLAPFVLWCYTVRKSNISALQDINHQSTLYLLLRRDNLIYKRFGTSHLQEFIDYVGANNYRTDLRLMCPEGLGNTTYKILKV